jgi:hypothetical protein
MAENVTAGDERVVDEAAVAVEAVVVAVVVAIATDVVEAGVVAVAKDVATTIKAKCKVNC